jgi:hypothetical protein
MTIRTRLKYLWPAWRRQEEREMREELASLTAIAGSKELGNLTLAMEDVRATWGWTWLESVLADIRYSLRALRRQPTFVAVAVLSLAILLKACPSPITAIYAIKAAPLVAWPRIASHDWRPRPTPRHRHRCALRTW